MYVAMPLEQGCRVHEPGGPPLTATAREFSSFFVVATSTPTVGSTDLKRDPPGFVHVIDSTTLAIPERKENALGFGPRNVLATGRIGLIFMISGQRETYRVNGTAHLRRDPDLLDGLAAMGNPALMATVVGVGEAFFHCAKATIPAELCAARNEYEAEINPIAEQIGALMGNENLVQVVPSTLSRTTDPDGLY